MPDAANPISSFVQPNSALLAATEAIVTTIKMSGVRTGQKVTLTGIVQVLQGVAAGAVNIRFRRGALTGALVQPDQASVPTLAIAENKPLSRVMFDVATSDDPIYVFTVTDSTAATQVEGAAIGAPT
jgi:hypothetical protein